MRTPKITEIIMLLVLNKMTKKHLIVGDYVLRRGMGGFRRCEVHCNDDAFSKAKFNIPVFYGKYDPNAYITWEIAVDQKFACHEFPENARVRPTTSEFTEFASVWWIEHGKKNPNNMPQTWDALKRVMQARFVPSYYARDMLNKLQQLR
jgi:hypothetical protein